MRLTDSITVDSRKGRPGVTGADLDQTNPGTGRGAGGMP